jgi:hypothetical protein
LYIAIPVIVFRQSTENPGPFAFLHRNRVPVPRRCIEKHAVLLRLCHYPRKKQDGLIFYSNSVVIGAARAWSLAIKIFLGEAL